MEVINNGKGLTLELDYIESAILTEALRKGAQVYEKENAPEFAKQVNELINDLLNNQIIK